MEYDKDLGHHIVVKGHAIQTGSTTTYMMYYVNPHYDSAHNGVYSTTMELFPHAVKHKQRHKSRVHTKSTEP